MKRLAEICNRSDGAGIEIWFPGAVRTTGVGHNSKAVHRAHAKHAEVTVLLLADWEKNWQENPQRNGQPKLLPVDFRSPVAGSAQAN